MEQSVYIFQKEIKIFKIEDYGDICADAEDQNQFPERLFLGKIFHGFGKQEIRQNTAADDQQIGYVKITVKPEGHADQKDICRPIQVDIIQKIVSAQRYGEKQKNKIIRIK